MLPVWRSVAFIAITTITLLAVGTVSVQAVVGIDEPLIPCGTSLTVVNGVTEITNPCTVCHFFSLIQNIYNFIIFVFVPPLAILMVAIAGFYWLTSGANQGNWNKGTSMLKTVVIGLAMIYAAWLIVAFGLNLIASSVAKNGEIVYDPAIWYNPSSWFKISCDYTAGKSYICPDDYGTIIPSKLECDQSCSQACEEAQEAQQSELLFSAGVQEISLSGSASISWSIGQDSQGDDIDNTSCQVIAEGTIQNDPPGIKDQLTDAVRAGRSGSTIVSGFTQTGVHSYTLVCGSYAKNASFMVSN